MDKHRQLLAADLMQAGTAARIDRAMVDSLRDLRGKNDASLFNQLYQGFAERARAAQSDVYAAAARGDWTTTLTILHKHRSSSGFLGLALYSQLCGELETLARAACDGDPPSALAWSAAFDAAAVLIASPTPTPMLLPRPSTRAKQSRADSHHKSLLPMPRPRRGHRTGIAR